mmetsp:Transcript_17182/g.31178  ORF Transcript_17182/g.31178 Transcript_17182/m.31178 type:complete len:224 (-) Transcript_17182:1157-1828(-)
MSFWILAAIPLRAHHVVVPLPPGPAVAVSSTRCVLPSLKHTSRDELLDLGRHARVLHGPLARRLVAARKVLDDLVDHRVSQDGLNLGVRHAMRRALLVHLTRAGRRIHHSHGLRKAVFARLVVGLNGQALLVRLERLVVLLPQELNVTFTSDGLDVLRIELQRLLACRHRTLEVHNLAQRRGKIVVVRGVLRVALDRFLVFLNRGRPVLRPEGIVPSLLRLEP